MKAKYFYLFLLLTSMGSLFAQSRTESLVMELSKEKFKYLNKANLDKLKPMLDDRLIFVHSNGLTENKAEMIGNLEKEKWSVEKVTTRDVTVRVFKNDVAILNGKGKFTVNSGGSKQDMDLAYTEVWVHYKKAWLLASRHANRLN
jgi:hypothetical protein